MRIHLPEQIPGARDALFVLDVQMAPAQVERRLELTTKGNLEALDLRGTGPGGSYTLAPGQDQLHIPLRVTTDGAGEASVELRCLSGPEAGHSEARSMRLTAAPLAAPGGRSRVGVALGALAALVIVGVVFGPKLLGGDKVPTLTGKKEAEATQAARAAKYKVRISQEDVSAEDRDGVVVRQRPAGGSEAPQGSEIELFVGRYLAAMIEVPDLVGSLASDAESALRAAGFQPMVSFRPPPSPDKVGRVLSRSPRREAQRSSATASSSSSRAAARAPCLRPGRAIPTDRRRFRSRRTSRRRWRLSLRPSPLSRRPECRPECRPSLRRWRPSPRPPIARCACPTSTDSPRAMPSGSWPRSA